MLKYKFIHTMLNTINNIKSYLSENRSQILYDIIIGTFIVTVGAYIAIGVNGYFDTKKSMQEYNDILFMTFIEATDNVGRIVRIQQNTNENRVSLYRLSNSLILSIIQHPLFSRYSTPTDIIELSTMLRRIDSCNKMLDLLSNTQLKSRERADNVKRLNKLLKRLYDSTAKYINKNTHLAEKIDNLSYKDKKYLKDIGISFYEKKNGKSFQEYIKELDDNKNLD